MKKCINVVLIIAFLLCLCACDSPVLPPVRDTGGMYVSLAIDYTFDIAVDEADLIAHVKIGDWLGEKDEGVYSFFDAEVLHIYKGEKVENIVVTQKGNSKGTDSRFPLFTHGNELLLFLKNSDKENDDNNYFSLGLSFCPFYATKSKAGDIYYFAQRYHIAEDLPAIENYANFKNLKIYFEALKNLESNDPLLKKMDFVYAYSKSDMERYIQESMSKQ